MKQPRRFWTRRDLDRLAALYPDTRTADLARRFGRTERAIYTQVNKLGLRKSAQYLAGPHAFRFSRGDAGQQTRFKPGYTPWNAGKKGFHPGGRSADTRFQPGHRINNLPIGTERLTKDGYLERKTHDTGTKHRDWVSVRVLLWTEHHGPIPPGHIVVMRAGDRADPQLQDLELIDRAEHLRRNSIHRYPPELVKVIRAAGKLRRTIEEHPDEKQD